MREIDTPTFRPPSPKTQNLRAKHETTTPELRKNEKTLSNNGKDSVKRAPQPIRLHRDRERGKEPRELTCEAWNCDFSLLRAPKSTRLGSKEAEWRGQACGNRACAEDVCVQQCAEIDCEGGGAAAVEIDEIREERKRKAGPCSPFPFPCSQRSPCLNLATKGSVPANPVRQNVTQDVTVRPPFSRFKYLVRIFQAPPKTSEI